jgi:hypothetical protein
MKELEALLSKRHTVTDCKDTPGNVYADYAQEKNSKAQKGAGSGGVDQPSPTFCHNYSTTEYGEEGIHVEYIVLALQWRMTKSQLLPKVPSGIIF